MCILKKSYFYNPQIRKDDLGYSVDIYEYDGRKSKLICCYSDKDYAMLLLRVRGYVKAMTKYQK